MDQRRTDDVVRDAMRRSDQVGETARSVAVLLQLGGSDAGRGLMQISNALSDAGELDDATVLAMAGRELLQAVGDDVGVATATMELGLIQLDRGQADEAITLLSDAKSRLEADDPHGDLPAATLNLGNALRRAGDPRAAMLQYEAAGARYAEIGDPMGIANASFNIGNACVDLGRTGTALERYREAKDIYGMHGRQDKVADCDLAAGAIVFGAGDPSVFVAMLGALETYERLDLPVELARGRLRVAHLLVHGGNHAEAAGLASGARRGFEEMGMWADALDAVAVLVHTHLGLGDLDAAERVLAEGRELADRHAIEWSALAELEAAVEAGEAPPHDHRASVEGEVLADDRFIRALQLAVDLHGAQRRKSADGDPPGPWYTGHILGVAARVIDAGGTREQVIGALLHDAVEDSPLSIADVDAMFGGEVAAIVAACTDAETTPKPPWRERKQAYLDALESGDHDEALLVTAADKLHNVRSMLVDHSVVGDDLWARFNKEADHGWYYGEVSRIVSERLDDPIAAELAAAVDDLKSILDDR